MECSFPTGQAAAAKRQHQREQPGSRAEFAPTYIAVNGQHYTYARPDGAIISAIFGTFSRAGARQRAATEAPHNHATL